MRATVGLLMAVLWLGTGCAPNDAPYGTGDTRPGSAQDTGSDQPPSGSSSENNVPPTQRPGGDPSTPATPPR